MDYKFTKPITAKYFYNVFQTDDTGKYQTDENGEKISVETSIEREFFTINEVVLFGQQYDTNKYIRIELRNNNKLIGTLTNNYLFVPNYNVNPKTIIELF